MLWDLQQAMIGYQREYQCPVGFLYWLKFQVPCPVRQNKVTRNYKIEKKANNYSIFYLI